MAKKQTNQRAEILKHLKRYRHITSMEAFELYGATRLSAIIYEFRQQGYDIETIMVVGKTRYGTPTEYAEYKYHGRLED